MINETLTRAAQLRQQMVTRIREHGRGLEPALERALLTVPREVFAPGADLETVYGIHQVVVTKRDSSGAASSSVSAPWLQALMLEQSRIEPGMRVLEIGSGGYNAALLAELVGDSGQVTTVDIDPWVTARARAHLDEAGYPQVRVVTGDAGQHGVPEHAPYDRVLVTVGAWDIPPTWLDQLTPDGILVVPLRVREQTHSFALERRDGHVVATDREFCGFIPMAGVGAHATVSVRLHEHVRVDFDDHQPTGPRDVTGVLEAEPVEEYSGVSVGGAEPFDTLAWWLACVMPGAGVLVSGSEAKGVVRPASKYGTGAVVREHTAAYVATRRIAEGSDGYGIHELGVIAHGPDAHTLARDVVDQIQHWHHTYRHNAGPQLTIWPKSTPEAVLPPGSVVDKHHTRVVLTWPAAHSPGTRPLATNT